MFLLSGEGQVIGRTTLERPFASIKPAPLHGVPVPTFLFEVNYSSGIGGFSGPAAQLLAPIRQGLTPLQAVPERGGRSEPIMLASTLHALSQIDPTRNGATEAILEVTRPVGSNGEGRLHLRIYRFRDGRWVLASRTGDACGGGIEEFPDRRLFP